ncbi:ethylene-responsive transcription factor RAP2-7-like [Olea europaea var. sylvestris]|uniref:ethylene-responsive transcription factor RAP2-7-like n=1 Tax=Olea europaea var. sylvestris TaxID=158386 RepID=UPI000C1D2073|nr:ethylene-responsive transcription factor RAP2-7-like [Olea europaea var. sylvestris]
MSLYVNSRQREYRKREEEMFDLNLSIDLNGKVNFEEDESPVTSTSSVVNGEGSSTCSPETSYTFNFAILDRNSPVVKDRGLTVPEPVTRELFPMSEIGELNMGKANNNVDQRFTNFESSKYDRESMLEGSQNDLDLNLGISTSSPKENECLALPQFQPYDVQNARKSKIQMDSPLKGLPLTTSRAGLNPNLVSFCEERVAEKRVEVSQGLPYWGWRVDSQAIPMAIFSPAASSGFSSPATTSLSTDKSLYHLQTRPPP